MHAPQLLFKSSPATLLLVLFWRLGTSILEEDTENIISLSMAVPQLVKPNEEFLLTLTVTNNMDKCMEVKISTEDNPSISYAQGHLVFTACVCGTQNFYWYATASENTTIVGDAEVVSEKDICPAEEELYPAVGHHVSDSATVTLTP